MPSRPTKANEHELLAGVETALAELPHVNIVSSKQRARVAGLQFDGVIRADVKGRQVLFVVEAKSGGSPRDMQAAAWHLVPVQHMSGKPESADEMQAVLLEGNAEIEDGEDDAWTAPWVPLVAAPSISQRSREFLRQRGLAYWDSGGSLFLEVPWAYYLIDRPPPPPGPRGYRNIYRGSTAQVLHALLLQPGERWHITDLAIRADVATSTVHEVFTFLEEQLWMEREGKGPQSVRVLTEPGALLDAWAEAHSLSEYVPYRFHRWAPRPGVVLKAVTSMLEHQDVNYALTLGTGAQRTAPFATPPAVDTLLVSAEANVDAVAAAADLRRVDNGEVVTLLATRDRSPLMFRQRMGDAWVASDIQLYLDLYAWPQRGKEQAKHLREQRIRF